MSKVYSCSCCGSDVTVPYFFKGGVYGYTCIKKVDPKAKRTKDNGLWIAYQELIITQRPNANVFDFAVICNGKKFDVGFSYSDDASRIAGLASGSKLFRIAQYANGTNPVFKSPVINTTTDSKGNPYVVSVEINGLPA